MGGRTAQERSEGLKSSRAQDPKNQRAQQLKHSTHLVHHARRCVLTRSCSRTAELSSVGCATGNHFFTLAKDRMLDNCSLYVSMLTNSLYRLCWSTVVGARACLRSLLARASVFVLARERVGVGARACWCGSLLARAQN